MNTASNPPTMAQIAEIAGVSKMSVSLALRGSPKVSESTRKRILKIAEEMHYRPNPMVQALMANLRTTGRITMHSAIAWVTCFDTEDGWTQSRVCRQYYQGALRRAEQLGYRLEPFWLRSEAMTEARLSSVLRARGILGVIIPPVPSVSTRILLDWQHFACATIGYSFMQPVLPRSAANLSESMSVVLQKCEAAGYKRIGFVITEETDDRVKHAWLSILLAWQQFIPTKDLVPYLYVKNNERIQDQLGNWLNQHKPDVIVSANSEFLNWLPHLFGLQIPRDIGFVSLAKNHTENRAVKRVTGINQRDAEVSAASVDLVVAQIQNNEIGLPDYPKVVLSSGKWEYGGTTKNEPIEKSVPGQNVIPVLTDRNL